MKIRKAEIKDAPTLSKLFSQCGYPSLPEQIIERMSKMKSSEQHCFIAENDGKIIGVIEFILIPKLYRKEPAGHISALVIDENHRNQGVGQNLINFINDLAASLGCVYIEVSSNKSRTLAHKFYEKNDYTEETHRYFRKYLSLSKFDL